MKFLKYGITMALAFGLTGFVAVKPANAQKVHKKHLEKARWHNAPRQFQIIDDRPIIKDFREAPAQAEHITMPPPPRGFHGGGRGGGSGAGGDGPRLLRALGATRHRVADQASSAGPGARLLRARPGCAPLRAL